MSVKTSCIDRRRTEFRNWHMGKSMGNAATARSAVKQAGRALVVEHGASVSKKSVMNIMGGNRNADAVDMCLVAVCHDPITPGFLIARN
jgi:hypothetical protein